MTPRPFRTVLAVPPKVFLIIWWSVQLFHVVCAVYAYAVIEIHQYFIVNELGITIDYLGTTTFSYFEPVISANIVLIVCHGLAFFVPVFWSIKYRDWRFTDMSTESKKEYVAKFASRMRQKILASHDKATLTPINPQRTMASRPATNSQVLAAVRTSVRVLGKAGLELYDFIGKFGPDGTYYESTYFALELVQIGFQTYQAYKLSGLVSRVWINRLNAIVLILNCWSTVFVHMFVRRERVVKRVGLLLADTLFDVITSMAIPFAIFYPYYEQFDFSLGDFPLVNYYDDVWFVQAISENRQIFVTSWLDFFSRFGIGISILGSMLVLKQYLVIDRTAPRDVELAQNVVAPAGSGARGEGCSLLCRSMDAVKARIRARVAPSQKQRGPTITDLAGARDHEDTPGGDVPQVQSEERVAKAVVVVRKKLTRHDWLLMLCGLAILMVHVHATAIAVFSNVNGCLLEVRPWFQPSYSCTTLEVNCAFGQYGSGSDDEALRSVADMIDVQKVKALVISSCARLHMPPMLRTFSGLQMIKVYNSTIKRWDRDAELHDDLHRDLQMLYISDSNFSTGELPPGLLGDKFPSRLIDIEFSGTNLVRLPSNLHESWAYIQYFVLERSPQITEFPEALVVMKIPQLMIGSNAITTIPDDLLADQAFWLLSLNGNPLIALPAHIGTLETIYRLQISYTLVSSLPSWMTSRQYDPITGLLVEPFRGYLKVFAGGSPLCLDDNSTAATMRATVVDYFHWYCSPNVSRFSYPIAQERRWRAASTALQDPSEHG